MIAGSGGGNGDGVTSGLHACRDLIKLRGARAPAC